MLNRIRINFKYIVSKFTLIASMVFGTMSIIQIFIDWDIIGIKSNDLNCKIRILFVILGICIIISVIWGVLLSNKKTIYSVDDVEIIVKYGDLMQSAFPHKQKGERIVVIAVNCCFDTIVDQNIIRKDTVHGQFLMNYANTDDKRKLLNDQIEKSLEEFDVPYKNLDKSQKKYGKLKRYPLGSVARINGENGVVFFLLALTEFDINCVAHCNKHQYVDCLLKLFEYYDEHGQGKDLYLYPMGTSMARTGLTKEEALESVTVLTKISKEHLKSKTTIIVDKKCKNEISISNL